MASTIRTGLRNLRKNPSKETGVTRPAPGPTGLISGVSRHRLVAAHDIVMSNPRAQMESEMFRRLKALLIQNAESAPQTILVTSAVPNEGKTFVSFNLALTLAADTSSRTLIVDTDLRRPSVVKKITPDPAVGLFDVLDGTASLEQAICRLEDSPLHVLAATKPVDDPVKWLSSAQTKRIFESLRDRYERVIIDSPPVIPFADAQIVSEYADGVILVVRAGVTKTRNLERAFESIGSAPLLGTVLNGAQTNLADGGKYKEKYYYKYYEKDR